jgi:pimeloyl-ACP methyl ester carboxylesterase
MKKLVLSVIAGLFGIGVSSAQDLNKPTIVLVHGAWSDSTAWNMVTPVLKAKGFDVVKVSLPGHGEDNTPFPSITLKSYVDAVEGAIGDKKNITLVGHSMAGVVISQVAEDMPGSIKKLIYLSAYLPANGQSLLDIATKDAGSLVGKHLQIDKEKASAGIAKEGTVDIFVADASKNIKNKFSAGVKSDPLIPFATPVTLTDARFGTIVKVYIYSINDHAISYATQQSMVNKIPGVKTYSLKSGHTPFLSMPGKVASILIKEAK